MTDPAAFDVAPTMLKEARVELAQADQKAALILAALGIGVSAVLGGALAGSWTPTKLQGPGQLVWWCGAGVVLYAAICAALAVWPRFKLRQNHEIHYWGDVVSYENPAEFAKAFAQHAPDSERRCLEQLWHISGIVRRKFELIRAAMISTGLGIALVICAVGIDRVMS